MAAVILDFYQKLLSLWFFNNILFFILFFLLFFFVFAPNRPRNNDDYAWPEKSPFATLGYFIEGLPWTVPKFWSKAE